jgi:hypothetical protein
VVLAGEGAVFSGAWCVGCSGAAEVECFGGGAITSGASCSSAVWDSNCSKAFPLSVSALLSLALALSSFPVQLVSALVSGAFWWAPMSMSTSGAQVVCSGGGLFLTGVAVLSAAGEDARA